MTDERETWNESSNRRLRQLLWQGRTDREIAMFLERPLAVIKTRIAKLGIVRRVARPMRSLPQG